VAEALAEREALLGIAPHIVWPVQFVLPHEQHLRPAWMIRAGLFLYDHLGRGAMGFGRNMSTLPGSRNVVLEPEHLGKGLKPVFTRGFAYYDCWVDDARLVVLNARSAASHGADILTRTRCTGAERWGDRWRVRLRSASGDEREVTARALVNAAGPWAESFLQREIGVPSRGRVRLVKGSHIVVPRIHDQRYAYILQNPDRRVVFMIPYEREFTLVGTTDLQLDAMERDGVGQIRLEVGGALAGDSVEEVERDVGESGITESVHGVPDVARPGMTLEHREQVRSEALRPERDAAYAARP